MSDAPEPLPQPAPKWQESASEFISARKELFAIEAKAAGEAAARKGVLAGIIAFFAVIAWLTIVAGVIGWISAASGSAWYFVTLGAAAAHLIVAGAAAVLLRRPTAPTFPLLKAELSKDREWLDQLKEKPKR